MLVVEDEEVHAKLLGRLFSGVEVRTARGGSEAIEMLKQQSPGCVVLDLNMPGMDGWEVADWIRKRFPELPVIVITAYHDDSFEQRAVDMGLAGYMRKPIILDEFVSVMGRLLPVDLLRSMKEPCLTCGRTGMALLDVTTISEASQLWKKPDNAMRSEAAKWKKGSKRSGRQWLMLYSVAAEEFGDEVFAWRYWLAPELSCPGCGQRGDPLWDIIGVTDDFVLQHGKSAEVRVRYGLTTGNVIGRKAGYFWIIDKRSVEGWLESLASVTKT